MSRSRGAIALARTGALHVDIARRAGVSPAYVSMLLSGKETPAMAKRVALRDAYRIDPSWWDEPGAASVSTNPRVLDLGAACTDLRAEMRDPTCTPPSRAALVQRLAEQLASDGCASFKLLMVLCCFDADAVTDPLVRLLRTRWPEAREALLQAYEAETEGEP